jgi:alginate O-acetyltransferase complex protein AlgI
VVWGGLHGVYLAAHKKLVEYRPPRQPAPSWLWFVKGLVTFQLVCVTWLFFRAATFGQAWTYLTGIVTWRSGDMFFGAFDLARCAILIACLLAIDIIQEWPSVIPDWARRPSMAGLAYGMAMVVWLALGGVDADVPFIYFQF